MTKVATMNRTGTRATRALLEGTIDTDDLLANDEPAPGPTDTDMRMTCIEEADSVGSRTDIPTEPAKATLLDSLGGRLAYERGGVRLYEAIIRKAEATAHLQGLREILPDLEHICQEEEEHAELLKRVIDDLDGDPTLETPCADIEGVMSSGLLQVVHDPRTTVLECLRCAVVAELADVENWTSLVKKIDGRVDDSLLVEVSEALEREQDHLETVRRWIATAEESPVSRSKPQAKAQKNERT